MSNEEMTGNQGEDTPDQQAVSGGVVTQSNSIGHDGEDDIFSTAVQVHRLPRITPVTLILIVVFVLSVVGLLGVMSLPVFRDFFSGEAVFWVLRIGLVFMIALIIAYFVFQERSNFRYAERLVEQTSEANRCLRLMLRAGRDLGSSLELESILERTLEYTFAITSAEMGAVYLWDKNDNALRLSFARGIEPESIAGKLIPVGQGLLGEAARYRKILAIDDVPRLGEGQNVFSGAASPSSQVVVPLVAGGKFVGVLAAGTHERHSYTPEERRMLEGLAELASLAVTNAELFKIARRSIDAVARQREVTGLVLDKMIAGVITADGRGRITIFNREAQRLTGYDFEEVAGAPLRSGAPLEENPLGPLQQGMLEVLQQPSVREGDALILRKDKSLLSVSYRINPLLEGSEVLGATAVFMEAKEAPGRHEEQDEVDYQLFLRSLGSTIERIYTHPFSRVVKQIRTLETDDWNRNREKISRLFEAGSGRLTRLLKDVEQYLNCITVREWDSPGEHDLVSIVGEVVEQAMRSPTAEGVVASVALSGVPPAYGYERMVRSALEQVIENACLAAAVGGKRVEIKGGKEGGGFVRVEVFDNGPGIAAENLQSIFNPFFTTWENRSGLGLSIVRRVMKRLGGNIQLAQSENGTSFLLDFQTRGGALDDPESTIADEG